MTFFPIPPEKYVKITAFCYKKPDISLEQFLKHWRETHVEKFTRNPKLQGKLMGYVQVCGSPCSHRQSLMVPHQCQRAEDLTKQMTEWPLADYDGYAEFYVKSMDDWLEIASDPQHLAETVPDMMDFCDVPKMKLLITNYEPRYWEIPPASTRGN